MKLYQKELFKNSVEVIDLIVLFEKASKDLLSLSVDNEINGSEFVI
ncbi:MAG: hypothetical protein LBI41_03675 [Lactobacillales bacterium]|jgi:hypothetical protein|nr:hypothetical protein [Lactobacillales bacterium]